MIIGSDMTPLMTGQVDAVTGWITNTTALEVLGADYIALRLWDCGVRLYALPYYATTDTLTQKPDLLAGFLRAAGRGGPMPKSIRRRRSICWCRNTPISCALTSSVAAPIMFDVEFTARTKDHGWGSFDPAVWQAQIDQYDELSSSRPASLSSTR